MSRLPFRRLNLSTLLLMVAIPGTNLLAQQHLADGAKSSASPSARVSAIKTFEQYAPYWSSEPGWDTELQLKNNLAAAPLTVTPILRLASGQEIPLTPVTIPANASVSIWVNESLQEHSPDLLGRTGSYGSVTFRFASLNAMSLHATAVPSIPGGPTAFRIQAHPAWDPTDTRRGNGPGSLEGIWWQPRSGLNDVLVIGNSSDTTVSGTLSLFDAGGKRWSEPVSFGPHQIERMAMSDLVRTARLTGTYGGISFEVPTSASAIDGVHFMYDDAGKFSASLEMFNRDPNSTVRERTGSDQKQWTIRAPMLALRRPDPALGLSPKTKLQPAVLVRNTTARNVSAQMTLTWRNDSGMGQVKLTELQLGPFATQQLQIWAMQKQLGIPDDAHWAMVSVTTNGAPDDLIAVASSRDCSGVYNVETKFAGGQGSRFAGGEWRLDATHNQIAAITNVGTQPTDALLTLHYDNGERKYELQQTIAPGDQMWVNLGQLVRDRVTDRSGNFLPIDVSAVTYDLQDLTPGGHNLMANDLAVNSATGQAVPDCPKCCGVPEYSLIFAPDPIELIIDGIDYPGIEGTNACSGEEENLSADFSFWDSDDASIAVLSAEKAQGVGVGSTTGYAQGDVQIWGGECGCSFEYVQPTVPMNVRPVISGPNTVWYFNGFSPSGYATSIQLTSSGGSNTTWNITAGANKVRLSTTTGSSTTITSSGSPFSSAAGDITVTATASEQTSAPFSITSRTPYSLSAGTIQTSCDSNYGYSTYISYTIQDQLLAPLPAAVPLNENWTTAVVNDYSGANWTRQPPGNYTTTGSTFADHIGGMNLGASPIPVPTCNGNSTPVQHWGQEWLIGSLTIGSGTLVQTDTLQKYIGYAAHLGIVSPVP